MRLKLDFSSFFLNKFQQFLKISGFLEIQMLSFMVTKRPETFIGIIKDFDIMTTGYGSNILCFPNFLKEKCMDRSQLLKKHQKWFALDFLLRMKPDESMKTLLLR